MSLLELDIALVPASTMSRRLSARHVVEASGQTRLVRVTVHDGFSPDAPERYPNSADVVFCPFTGKHAPLLVRRRLTRLSGAVRMIEDELSHRIRLPVIAREVVGYVHPKVVKRRVGSRGCSGGRVVSARFLVCDEGGRLLQVDPGIVSRVAIETCPWLNTVIALGPWTGNQTVLSFDPRSDRSDGVKA